MRDADRDVEWGLIQAWQAGCRKAGAQLVARNQGLLHTWVRACRRPYLEPDLYQEAVIALLHAASEYDPVHGTKLCTYAHWKVKAALRHYMERNRLVPLPQSSRNDTVIRAYRQNPEVQSTALAGEGLSLHTVESMLQVLRGRSVALGSPEGEALPAAQRTPEEALIEAQLQGRVRDLLAKVELSAREQQILQERFVVEQPRSLTEIGKEHNISRQGAHVADQRLRGKLRRELAALEGSW